MEGADRLTLGRETGTWSHLLREGVSVLASYKVLVLAWATFPLRTRARWLGRDGCYWQPWYETTRACGATRDRRWE